MNKVQKFLSVFPLKEGACEVRGQTIQIRELNAKQRDKFMRLLGDPETRHSAPYFIAANCVLDKENGESVFEGDMELAGERLTPEIVDTITAAVLDLSPIFVVDKKGDDEKKG